MTLFRKGYLLLYIFVAACAGPQPGRTSTSLSPLLVTITPAPTLTYTELPKSLPSSTPTDEPATVTASARICPPFPGYTQAQLIDAISNPFRPPSRPGSDDPHQAVDLAVTLNGISLEGEPVHLMLDGRGAAVIGGRFPYGNALLVETPLETLPTGWLEHLPVPTPAPTLDSHPSLTCPQLEGPEEWNPVARSLYLLYAHLGETPNFQLGEPIDCGAEIGVIGQTGNALNPHIHLEARVGPANASFEGIAHYETRAAPEEMWGYCTWRVSGIFQLVDPTRLLELLP